MKLSACMIVKNEEKMLPRCLDSIKNVVDEIVVVDTGSTDKTIDILKSYGAKLYEHPWQDDFSLHRNQSIGYAQGDWLLIIDADEELVWPNGNSPEDFKNRFGMLSEETTALAVRVHEKNHKTGDIDLTWPSARFFKNGIGFHYVNPVHNRPKLTQGKCAGTDLQLYHYGYSLDPKTMTRKRLRTLNLLKERIKADPKDYNAHFYLCQTYFSLGDFETGIYHAQECWRWFPYDDPAEMAYYGLLYYSVGMAFLKLDDLDNAYRSFRKGFEYFPKDLDINYGLAYLGFLSKRPDIGIRAARTYLDCFDEYHEPWDLKSFRNAMPPALYTPRHVHTGTKQCRERVEKWLEIMENDDAGRIAA